MASIWDSFQNHFVWHLGNEHHINFWLDKWMSYEHSHEYLYWADHRHHVEYKGCLGDHWDMGNCFPINHFPLNKVKPLMALSTPTNIDGSYSIGYGGTNTRHFTV